MSTSNRNPGHFNQLKDRVFSLLRANGGALTDVQVLRGLQMPGCRILDIQIALRALVNEGRIERTDDNRYWYDPLPF